MTEIIVGVQSELTWEKTSHGAERSALDYEYESAGNLSGALRAKAKELMEVNFNLEAAAELDDRPQNNESNTEEKEDSEPACPRISVKHLVADFESRGQADESRHAVDEPAIVSSVGEAEESTFLHHLISTTGHNVEKAAKTMGHAVKGVVGGVKGIAHRAENVITDTFNLPQSSLEENPHNNIHVPHPDKDNGGMIGLGMHIQKVDRGHLMRVLPDGLAHKSKLQDNDVIVAVNEHDVTSWAFEELQHFFGSLQEVVIKLLVERKEEKESVDGEPVYNKITITITLSFEDDKVVVKIDVPDAAWRWHYVGVTESYYIIQDHSNLNTKYLMFKDNSFCMSHASDLTPCKFNLLKYYPNVDGPRVLMNMSQDKPLDISKDTRIGTNGEELYGDGLQILSDKRFFFNMKQKDTKKFTFKLTSQKYHYLVVDADGKLTTQEFSNIESVDASGRFDLVQTSQVKLQPSSLQKGQDKDTKPNTKW